MVLKMTNVTLLIYPYEYNVTFKFEKELSLKKKLYYLLQEDLRQQDAKFTF